MRLLWKFKEACTQHVVIGSKQGHANLIARPHLPPFQVESVGLAESPISDVCTKYTCLFDCAPAGVIALNQKGKSFSFLIPGHLHTLLWWLPTAWGASPSLTNDFPDCLRFCYCGLGIGGGGASSWLVICSAEEVLLLRVVWKFLCWLFINISGTKKWLIYVHVWQLRPWRFWFSKNLYFEKSLLTDLDAEPRVRTTGWGIWLRENGVCLSDVLFRVTVRWPF